MTSRLKKIERADALQDSSVSAWYLAVCLLVVVAGGIWAANAIGWLDIGSGQSQGPDKAAVVAAARKAADREAQARLAAQQEARNLAEDSARQAVTSASPVATASAKPADTAEDPEAAKQPTP